MESTNNESKLVDGFYTDRPSEKAPDFVVSKFNVTPRFIEFYEKNKDEKGNLRGDILRAQSGKYYAKLDTWKLTGEKKEEKTGEVDVSGIPF